MCCYLISAGHVSGLLHEHQRPDRDHYLCFNYGELRGYDPAKEIVKREDNHDINEVCANGALTAIYSFSSVNQFDTIDHLDPASEEVNENWWWKQNYAERDYGHESIMHYDSDATY